MSSRYVRLIRISATSPNYEDVATFGLMRREAFSTSTRNTGLVVCNSSSSIPQGRRRLSGTASREVCYEKVIDQAGKNQTLMFDSRKENAKAARFLWDTATEKETITQFVELDGVVRDPDGESSQREKLEKLLETREGPHSCESRRRRACSPDQRTPQVANIRLATQARWEYT